MRKTRVFTIAALTMVFLATACSQTVEKPPRIIITPSGLHMIAHKMGYKDWEKICFESKGYCPRYALKGMIALANTFAKAKNAFSWVPYAMYDLKRKALLKMLQRAKTSEELRITASYAGPIDKKIEALAYRLAKRALD